MVVQTIRLADQPNLFRHRKGAKVVQRDADGYADAEWAGVIVDGTWRGDPSGGAYEETYRIKRDRGDYFDADEHTLLKRFDTDAELRDSGEGQDVRPAEIDASRTRPRGKRDDGLRADRRQLRGVWPQNPPGEAGAWYSYSYGVYHFHLRCNALWIEVRRQPRFDS